ncbi:hypothetical protein SKAU_G00203190 [Synaphobranchus kaupii]|uniref:Uncharacterized protein n=1 Tax=Synaphobranchus kaupii TaxID=118154 RepID=A0A9Q1FFV8_SYNKA|nr:hypothetical protein SKAU_G00203190 [Synaphobranchus kaupii]
MHTAAAVAGDLLVTSDGGEGQKRSLRPQGCCHRAVTGLLLWSIETSHRGSWRVINRRAASPWRRLRLQVKIAAAGRVWGLISAPELMRSATPLAPREGRKTNVPRTRPRAVTRGN